MGRIKTQSTLLPLLAVMITAVLIGISEPFFESVGFDVKWIRLWMTVCSLTGAVILLICFRHQYKGCGISGFFLGIGLGVLIFLMLLCLKNGGFGIFNIAGLILLFIYDIFFDHHPFSARNLTAVILCFCGMVLLTGTVSVTLFPFDISFSLPKADGTLFWQLTGALLSAAYCLLTSKVSSLTHCTLNASGQLVGLGICFGVLWYLADGFAYFVPDIKQLCLFIWCALIIAALCTLMAVYGISGCRAVQAKCALYLCIPAQLIMSLLLTHSFPPDFTAAIGCALTLCAVFAAERKQTDFRKK